MNIGISAIQVYFPNTYVNLDKLENYDRASKGKYTIGLGQSNMSVTNDREDTITMALTVTEALIKDYNINPKMIGRLEVGSESSIDRSKSIKSNLMRLFAPYNNFNIEGVDNINACYGLTSSIFNCIEWLKSDDCHNRYAIAVGSDIATYKNINARPTGGAGAIALLLTKNAPIIIDTGTRSSFMDHEYDFYKPNMNSEYPIVNGKYSNDLYQKSLKFCYKNFKKNFSQKYNKNCNLETFDYHILHTPYSKLIYKSINQLQMLDEVIIDKKSFEPGLYCSKHIGNTYTCSLWFCLVSLISSINNIIDKDILAFSYGSGITSTIFNIKIRDSVEKIKKKINLHHRLNYRKEISPELFNTYIILRENIFNKNNVKLTSNLLPITNNVYYLDSINDDFKRVYKLNVFSKL